MPPFAGTDKIDPQISPMVQRQSGALSRFRLDGVGDAFITSNQGSAQTTLDFAPHPAGNVLVVYGYAQGSLPAPIEAANWVEINLPGLNDRRFWRRFATGDSADNFTVPSRTIGNDLTSVWQMASFISPFNLTLDNQGAIRAPVNSLGMPYWGIPVGAGTESLIINCCGKLWGTIAGTPPQVGLPTTGTIIGGTVNDLDISRGRRVMHAWGWIYQETPSNPGAGDWSILNDTNGFPVTSAVRFREL